MHMQYVHDKSAWACSVRKICTNTDYKPYQLHHSLHSYGLQIQNLFNTHVKLRGLQLYSRRISDRTSNKTAICSIISLFLVTSLSLQSKHKTNNASKMWLKEFSGICLTLCIFLNIVWRLWCRDTVIQLVLQGRPTKLLDGIWDILSKTINAHDKAMKNVNRVAVETLKPTKTNSIYHKNCVYHCVVVVKVKVTIHSVILGYLSF